MRGEASSPAPRAGFPLTELDAGRLLILLVGIELLLAGAGVLSILVGGEIETVHALFDLDAESTIPTWFSSMQIFVIGATLLLASRWTPSSSRPSPASLVAAGIAFVLLSMDEASEFHEKLSWLLGNRFEALPRFRTGYGIWMYIYAPIALAVLFALRRDLAGAWRGHGRECRIVLLGVALVLFGAIGLESFGYLFLRDDLRSVGYRAEVVVEELFEMLGMSVVLYGTLLLAGRMASPAGPD